MSYPPPPPQPGPYQPPTGGPYPPPPPPSYFGGPPGYQQPWPPMPPRQQTVRNDGSVLTAIAIVCGVLGAVALFACLITGHNASACNSGIGEFAQALDRQAASQCTTANFVHAICEVATTVLGVTFAGCLAGAIARHRP
jgi:hypothetical protein